MIGLALSGGGSRAMAFHLGCLRALHDIGVLDRVGVLSTISGGSVIGAYFAYTPGKPFEEFEADIRSFLRAGFEWGIAGKLLLNPLNLAKCLRSATTTWAAEGLARLTRHAPTARREFSRSDLFRQVLEQKLFPGLRMSSARRDGLAVVVGACELRTGTAFRFGNDVSGDWRHGRLVDIDVDVAMAVAASAAYPMFLPAFDRTWRFQKDSVVREERVLLTDGGVYDNLGIQVLEPGRNAAVSLHHYSCEYLIACNAGHGQDAGESVPLSFFRRVTRSFEVVHRRVQDSTMNRLHLLKESGAIKGFALPYLGQIDERLPWRPSVLQPRAAVVGYPTDFRAMSDEWIEKLSSRGEQLTRCLLAQYCPELL